MFFAVCCEPTVSEPGARRLAAEFDHAFPILFDPRQIVARQAGVRALPEAVVLAPDGQVLYRGRVSPGPAAPGWSKPPAASYDLESALRSIDRDELPAVLFAPAVAAVFPRFVSGGRWA